MNHLYDLVLLEDIILLKYLRLRQYYNKLRNLTVYYSCHTEISQQPIRIQHTSVGLWSVETNIMLVPDSTYCVFLAIPYSQNTFWNTTSIPFR